MLKYRKLLLLSMIILVALVIMIVIFANTQRTQTQTKSKSKPYRSACSLLSEHSAAKVLNKSVKMSGSNHGVEENIASTSCEYSTGQSETLIVSFRNFLPDADKSSVKAAFFTDTMSGELPYEVLGYTGYYSPEQPNVLASIRIYTDKGWFQVSANTTAQSEAAAKEILNKL